MGIHSTGHLIKTRQPRDDGHGLYHYICHVEEGGMLFKRCQDYYWHIKREFDRHVGVYPDTYGPIKDADRKNLEHMCHGASYGVIEDTIHVDNWAVNEKTIFHKHPEFGVVDHIDGPAELEFTVKDGKCDMCGTEIPGEVLFLHKMYQL